MRRLPLALAAAFACVAAWAQTSVALQGVLGSKALLIVNGGAPKAVAPGDAVAGVRLVSAGGDQAVVEADGRRLTLRVGDAPASVGGRAPTGGDRIVLTAGSGGHFFAPGSINGRAVHFVVDTGATDVALSQADADRIGLKYQDGQRGLSSTANGAVQTWRLTLDSVRVGDVEVRGVQASVLGASMPYVLLGNSFLGRFQMKRENDQMVLERRF